MAGIYIAEKDYNFSTLKAFFLRQLFFDNQINQDKLVSESSVFPDPGTEAKMRFESK